MPWYYCPECESGLSGSDTLIETDGAVICCGSAHHKAVPLVALGIDGTAGGCHAEIVKQILDCELKSQEAAVARAFARDADKLADDAAFKEHLARVRLNCLNRALTLIVLKK